MNINTLLFSGGGMRGIAYVGLFKRLRKKFPSEIKSVCGVSIGAAFSLFWCLGYSYEELRDEILSKNFKTLYRIRVGNLEKSWGLDSGDGIRDWLSTFLIRKGVKQDITFSEFNHSLYIVSTNLSKSKLVLFNKQNTPHLKIIDACLMSMSIPFVFTCKKFMDDVFVDGAVISNFPVSFIKSELGIGDENLLGIKLVENKRGDKITDMRSYLKSLQMCITKNTESESCKNIIEIDVSGFPHLDFKMDKSTKCKLIKCGKVNI